MKPRPLHLRPGLLCLIYIRPLKIEHQPALTRAARIFPVRKKIVIEYLTFPLLFESVYTQRKMWELLSPKRPHFSVCNMLYQVIRHVPKYDFSIQISWILSVLMVLHCMKRKWIPEIWFVWWQRSYFSGLIQPLKSLLYRVIFQREAVIINYE